MKSMTIGEVFKGSWKDAGMALVDRPFVFLATFALLLIADCLNDTLGPVLQQMAATHGAFPADRSAAIALLCAILIRSVSISILYVQVAQYSALGADQARMVGILKGYWRYVRVLSWYTLFILAVTVVFSLACLFVISHYTFQTRSLLHAQALATPLLVFIFVFIHFRLSLIFCHAALGAKSNWGGAWIDTEGHFLSILVTNLLAYLPLLGIGILFFIVKALVTKGVPDHGFNYWTSLATTLWYIGVGALGAACSAWVYRRYAFFILQPR